jgi:spore maturation protein SpmB
MRENASRVVLRAVLSPGLASGPLFGAEISPDSGAGNFYALVLGLMATIFGGMALCYGLVKLTETMVKRLHAWHASAAPAIASVKIRQRTV